MDYKEVKTLLLTLIDHTWRNRMYGRNWIRNHHYSGRRKDIDAMSIEELKDVIRCVNSKRKLELCPIHDRVHDGIKNTP